MGFESAGIDWFSYFNLSSTAMNRYATEQDVILFEPFLSPNGKKIVPEINYILDSHNDPKGIATKRILITKAEEVFSKLVDGSVIWLVASALKDFESIVISNEYGPSGRYWPWPNITFAIIPDAQLQMKRGPQSHATNPFKIHGVKFPKIQFKSVQFPQWDINTPFQIDALPFHVSSDGYYDGSGHGFWLIVPDGGKAEVDGVNGGGGSFTFHRAQAEKVHGYTGAEFNDSYGHDTDSEPFYIGMSVGYPYAALKGWNRDRNLSVRAGTDGDQMGHLQGCEIGQIYIHNAATKRFNNFQRWQDCGEQINVDCGKNHIKTLFVDGFGSNGLSLLGSAPYTAPNGQPSFKIEPGDGLTIDKCYLYDGHLGIYLNATASQGLTWIIKELWIGGMHDEWATTTGEGKVDYYLNHAGTDKVIIEKLYHDGSRPRLAKDPSKFQVNEVILLENFPRPKYKYQHQQFINWSETVSDYHPNANGTRIKYKAGNYYTDRENGLPTVFLKCMKDHIANTIRPKYDPENFEIITYDEKGIPSDDPKWSETDKQRPYPGDNFTHEHDSPLKDFFWMTAPPKTETINWGLSYIQQTNLFLTTTEGNKYSIPVTPVNT